MDSGTTIIAIILLLVCIIPFIMMYIKSSRKEKHLSQALSKAASSQHMKINEQDIWHETAIGIDHAENVLFFIQEKNAISLTNIFPLHEVDHFKKVIEGGNHQTVQAAPDIAEKLGFTCSFKDKTKEHISIEFFNSKKNGMTISNEYLLLEKWHQIIQQKLSEIKLTSSR